MGYKELENLPQAEKEEKTRQAWLKMDIIHKTEDNRAGKPEWVFYEGPPTANGNPGIHHVIARTLKDSVNKFKTMQGFHVKKKAGWDTHGLPVEIEVEKQLGIQSKREIEEYGIKEFNEKCRESVFTYEARWREMTDHMAYFVDMDDPYITLKNEYIESEWWILDKFFKQGLMYEGNKILPYCPRCGTGLASHEVAQGYLNITTETVYVKFKRLAAENEYFLVWTTTPWTLASNVALAMGEDIVYVRARVGEEILILAESKAAEVLGEGYEVLSKARGSEFAGESYEQLMPFVTPTGGRSFVVANADFVTLDDGTGIVHVAPAFGEDDFNLGQKEKLGFVNPVNERGEYTDTPWKGMGVLEADKKITIWLKETGKLNKVEKVEHNYPHCWRCKTPLLYYAKPSWYIRVTDLRDNLLEANSKVEWYPSFIGEKRFGNWLENVKDWAISRNRYWGTPLNIWRCECGEVDTVASRKELSERAIEEVSEDIELHRPFIDEVHIQCPKCGKPMERVKDVIDCWFDSGSMPFAQYHYPFENEETFNSQFPADFICEGIDQTRGWFYSLIVIGTFLTKNSPYRRVLVNDLILDKNGRKMSKSMHNTVDPFELFAIYGADALRWYLLYVSPAWTPTRFDEEGLREVLSKFFSTLRNTYSFFALYANADGIDVSSFSVAYRDRDEMDRWLLSRYNSLLADVTESMESFDMTKAVRAIQDFVNDELSNWYIRRSRRRFWDSQPSRSRESVYLTTYEVLLGITKIIAPLAPFLAEELYQSLGGPLESVHLEDYPLVEESAIDEDLEREMGIARELARMGRSAREAAGLKVRQPLSEIIVGGLEGELRQSIQELIAEELNVKSISIQKDIEQYLGFTLKPNFKVAGKTLGKNVKVLASFLSSQPPTELLKKLSEESLTFLADGEDIPISADMLDIRIQAQEGYHVESEGGLYLILNTELTEGLLREGYAREVISKVQQLRKSSGFEVVDRIQLKLDSDEEIKAAVEQYRELIRSEILAEEISFEENAGQAVSLNGHEATIEVIKQH